LPETESALAGANKLEGFKLDGLGVSLPRFLTVPANKDPERARILIRNVE
jgi:hypothetical protein